jgi:cytochrome b6-f complex iron-sulfur subunit
MTTASVTKAKAAAPVKTQAAEVAPPNRREFLYYIWGASIVLLLGQAGAGLIWFALPRFQEGEFGGVFRLPGSDLPAPDTAPYSVPAGRFHISNVPERGVVALYGVCTHLGCLPKWVETTHRFECPCHGSKFQLSGQYIEGPAPTSLNRFRATIIFSDGTTATTDDRGDPIPLNGKTVAEIAVDTGDRILRSDKS